MGHGDQLLATGMARGAHARGKRIAFGDGRRIHWDKHSAEIFRGNPNIAGPGQERAKDLEWIPFFKGSRLYNRHDVSGQRWIWNLDFRPTPGELVFSPAEIEAGARYGTGFVLIEPNVVGHKSVAPNKTWDLPRYQKVAEALRADGLDVVQFRYDGALRRLGGVRQVTTMGFRDALAILANAALYIGPEGGLHHGAAAVGIPAVVLFGGFIPPAVTGYPTHANLTGGAEACGSLRPCAHCAAAMKAIGAGAVLDTARSFLVGRASPATRCVAEGATASRAF